MAYRRVSRLSSPLTAKAFTKRPFRAWFDPEKERLASNATAQLVTKCSLLLVSKVYFFPPACFVACWHWAVTIVPNPCGIWTMLLWLVYLTWTTLFVSAGIRLTGRGSIRKVAFCVIRVFRLATTKHDTEPNWDHHHTRCDQTVLICYFEIALKVTISLYTMSIRPDWTSKSAVALLLI